MDLKYWQLEHNDIDDFKQNLSFDVDGFLISGGKLKATRQIIQLSTMQIFYRMESAAMNIVCRNQQPIFMIGFPEVEMFVNGKSLTNDNIFLVTPGDILFTPMPENFSAYGLCFNEENVSRFLSDDLLLAMKRHADEVRTGKILLPYLNEFKAHFIKQFNALKNVETNSDGLQFQKVEFDLLIKLAKLFQPLLSQKVKKEYKASSRQKIISRAMDYLADRNKVNISVPELAQQCFCSTRSLEYTFKQFYKMPPVRFLNLRRLHLIRLDIKTHKFETLKMLNGYYGLSNAGRLSAEYFQLFGEYPRETWANHLKKEPSV